MKSLREIADKGDCTCGEQGGADVGYELECDYCIAIHALNEAGDIINSAEHRIQRRKEVNYV